MFRHSIISIIIVTAILIFNGKGSAQDQDHYTLSDISWLTGAWEGIGDDGKREGLAKIIWTRPVEGTMAMTFRWNMPDKAHVHYAFNVVQETEEGVFYRGIHRGRAFEPFEDYPWRFQLMAAGPRIAEFKCLEHCRGKAVTFTLLPNGRLEESWTSLDGTPRGFVVIYIKEGQNLK